MPKELSWCSHGADGKGRPANEKLTCKKKKKKTCILFSGDEELTVLFCLDAYFYAAFYPKAHQSKRKKS